MNAIDKKVAEAVGDSRVLRRLLALEKQRRKVPQDKLVFVGIHNIAQHWWCTQQAVFKSRANELQFFSAYLHDRIHFAHRLGLKTKLPRSPAGLLDMGDEISFAAVEKLHAKECDEAAANWRDLRTDHIAWLRVALRGGAQIHAFADKSGGRTTRVLRGTDWRIRVIDNIDHVTLLLDDISGETMTLVDPKLPEDLCTQLENSSCIEPIKLEAS